MRSTRMSPCVKSIVSTTYIKTLENHQLRHLSRKRHGKIRDGFNGAIAIMQIKSDDFQNNIQCSSTRPILARCISQHVASPKNSSRSSPCFAHLPKTGSNARRRSRHGKKARSLTRTTRPGRAVHRAVPRREITSISDGFKKSDKTNGTRYVSRTCSISIA